MENEEKKELPHIPVELVECYSQGFNEKKKYETGSAHFYLVDFGMDFRGVFFVRKPGNRIMVRLPQKYGVNLETDEKCFYPVLEFTDVYKKRGLLVAMKNALVKYFEEGGVPEYQLKPTFRVPNSTDFPKKTFKKPYEKREMKSFSTKGFMDVKPRTSSLG